jgi:hypothetical protein
MSDRSSVSPVPPVVVVVRGIEGGKVPIPPLVSRKKFIFDSLLVGERNVPGEGGRPLDDEEKGLEIRLEPTSDVEEE